MHLREKILTHKFYHFLFFGFIVYVLTSGCSSSSVSFLVSTPPEKAQVTVKNTMQKFGSVTPSKETEGYLYSYEVGFFHPYDVKLFVGSHLGGDGSSSIVRVEGDRNDTRILQDVLSQDFKLKDREYKKTYPEKSILAGHVLNLISPGFSHMYGAIDTPRRDLLSGTLVGITYMIIDFTLYMFSSQGFFFNNNWNAFSAGAIKNNWPWMVGTMGTFRVLTALDTQLLLRGHNKTIELGYKFRLE
jgi:hypothetical protein